MDNKVLVTGGAGFIGQRFLQRTSAEKLPIVSLYRKRLPQPSAHVLPIFNDLSSAELLSAPLRNIETVVHLAWDNTLRSEIDQFYGQNVEAFKHLVQACERVGVGRFIFVSTAGAHHRGHSAFQKEKYMCELCLLNSSIPEKIILRPSIVYGGSSGDKLFSELVHLMAFPCLYPSLRGQNNLQPVFVDDFIQVLVDGLRSPSQKGKITIREVHGPESLRLDQITQIFAGCWPKRKFRSGQFFAKYIISYLERQPRSNHGLRYRDFLELGQSQQRSRFRVGDKPLVCSSSMTENFSKMVGQIHSQI